MKKNELKTLDDVIDVYEKSKFVSEHILDTGSFTFMIIDEKGCIYRANHDAARIFKKEFEYLAGTNIKEHLESSQYEHFWKNFEILKKNGTSQKIQISLELADPFENKRTYFWDVAPLILPVYNLKLYQISGTDVSLFRKRVEEQTAFEKEISFEKKKNSRLNLLLGVRERLNPESLTESIILALSYVNTVLGFDYFILWENDEVEEKLSPKASSDRPELVDQFVELKSGHHLEVFQNKESEWFMDSGTDVVILLKYQDLRFGVIEFYKESALLFDREVFDLLKEVGQIVAEFIHHNNLLHEIKIKNAQIINSAKMAALGEMTGGIAHEINNPLTIIYGKAGYLIGLINKGKFDYDRMKTELQVILSTSDRISNIIKGMKSFSRNADAYPFIARPLAKLISSTLDLTAERFSYGGIKLEVGEIPVVLLECRESQIIQVLINLLNNAYDAVEDLKSKWVKLEFENLEKTISISVTDSGSGIPSAVIDKIMQPFFTTKDVGKGTGLGLSISLGIAKAHGGSMAVDRKSPHTKFVLVLPKQHVLD